MPTEADANIQKYRDWVFRYRPAQGTPTHLLLMLHGWTGDENSMWIFTRSVPGQVEILAPRAPVPAPEGGYTWRGIATGTWGYPSLQDLQPSSEAILDVLADWTRANDLSFQQFDLVGFSQGAALSYALVFLHPERVRSLAALSGFLPAGAQARGKADLLKGKPVFISHGRQDEMVPVDEARQCVQVLETCGAQVRYCESDGGHKVSKQCMAGLVTFFEDQLG